MSNGEAALAPSNPNWDCASTGTAQSNDDITSNCLRMGRNEMSKCAVGQITDAMYYNAARATGQGFAGVAIIMIFLVAGTIVFILINFWATAAVYAGYLKKVLGEAGQNIERWSDHHIYKPVLEEIGILKEKFSEKNK